MSVRVLSYTSAESVRMPSIDSSKETHLILKSLLCCVTAQLLGLDHQIAVIPNIRGLLKEY